MKSNAEFRARVEKIIEADPRYRYAAYDFVSQAVTATARKKHTDHPEASRHVSGQELLEGFKNLALEQFGCLTLEVLTDWGVLRTEDVGNIVFNLVNHSLLGANANDTPADFADGYAFREAFTAPFQPEADDATREPRPKIV